MTGSNRRPSACKADALPAELILQYNDSYGTRTRVTAVKGRCLNRLTKAMAPQVGLEPTTDRLTADSSTTELLWININAWQRSTLADVSSTTIDAKELNFCVRHGNRCDLLAIVTRHMNVDYTFKTR